MMGRWTLLILVPFLLFVTAQTQSSCPLGFTRISRQCVDIDECEADEEDYLPGVICGDNTDCFNTVGSYYCQCAEGFRSSGPTLNFTGASSVECDDINECLEDTDLCGLHAMCFNTMPYYSCICKKGFISSTGVEMFRNGANVTCKDIDECQEEAVCGQNAVCRNTQGSYECVCKAGFQWKSGESVVSGSSEPCEDINECQEEAVCGQNAVCRNTQGSYECVCKDGFQWKSGESVVSGSSEPCEGVCTIDKTVCGNGTCHQGASGHQCACHAGFTNYGNEKSRCTALDCDVFRDVNNVKEEFNIRNSLLEQLRKSCLDLTESEDPVELPEEEDLLKMLLAMIDDILSSGVIRDNKKISILLDLVEIALRFIAPFVKIPRINRSSVHTVLDLMVHNGSVIPNGTETFSTGHAQLDIQLETAAGDPAYYPGFTTVSLLSYSNLEDSADGFFGGMKPRKGQSFKLNSKVATVTVSNINTDHLREPVNITLHHLKQTNETSHICVFWNSSEDGGAWSPQGCSAVESNLEYTVCSCTHLSSFAVLMALYEIEDTFELNLITMIGFSLSLICLFACILTFSMIRSIQSPRTTIHLHLCISLFIAILVFLTSISRTQNRVGCAVVAGLLHFFFLAAFCWMCLEGIQLFRMVILVFNTNFKTLYMMVGGYGVPSVIVAISTLVNAKGYGTDRHCWLNLENIWSFFAPACVIIIINVFFFLITVWKLAQKFTSLNPDMDNLQKIKTFTITAVAQLCVLGTMWIFGCFQFDGSSMVMSYLFTIFGSLQGVMLFVMHCLFSKQVREEYGNFFSTCCAPRKKTYSEFSHTSKAHASKSSQDTGESHI